LGIKRARAHTASRDPAASRLRPPASRAAIASRIAPADCGCRPRCGPLPPIRVSATCNECSSCAATSPERLAAVNSRLCRRWRKARSIVCDIWETSARVVWKKFGGSDAWVPERALNRVFAVNRRAKRQMEVEITAAWELAFEKNVLSLENAQNAGQGEGKLAELQAQLERAGQLQTSN